MSNFWLNFFWVCMLVLAKPFAGCVCMKVWIEVVPFARPAMHTIGSCIAILRNAQYRNSSICMCLLSTLSTLMLYGICTSAHGLFSFQRDGEHRTARSQPHFNVQNPQTVHRSFMFLQKQLHFITRSMVQRFRPLYNDLITHCTTCCIVD